MSVKDQSGKSPKDISARAIGVTQYSLGGVKIREWSSIKEVMRTKGISDSHISQACKGSRNVAGGFQWRYTADNIESLEPIYINRKVQCVETKEIFETPNHAAKHFGYAQQTVKKSCMKNGESSKDYHFIWYDDLDSDLGEEINE